jgi:hypothetical protein
MLVAGVQTFKPFPVDGHGPRITFGRTVWRRETWNVPGTDAPMQPGAATEWARDRGLPRRVFALSPLEIKPIYVDFESPVLVRILCRQLRRLAADAPSRRMQFTEMLPGPEECWLEDEYGHRYTSELRLVAVDLQRRAARRGSNGHG